jgi:hypothetical protein
MTVRDWLVLNLEATFVIRSWRRTSTAASGREAPVNQQSLHDPTPPVNFPEIGRSTFELANVPGARRLSEGLDVRAHIRLIRVRTHDIAASIAQSVCGKISSGMGSDPGP